MSTVLQVPDSGMFFEDFATTMPEVRTTPVTTTQAGINAYVAVVGDGNPIHTDAGFAAEMGYERTINPGVLTIGFATGLGWQVQVFKGAKVALRRIVWDFSLRPVFEGDSIYAIFKVKETKKERRGGNVTFSINLRNQDNKPVGSGELIVFISNRPTAPSE